MSVLEFTARKLDGAEEDMCTECLFHVYTIDIPEQKTYILEERSSLYYTPPHYDEND